MTNLVCRTALLLACLVATCNAQAYGCGGALPSNIRVWAIPDTFYSVGPPASGFLVSLLEQFKTITGIPYTLTPHPELNYGNQNANGSFDGSLIGALVNNQADLVGADLTLTYARASVVDFLIPYQRYQLEIAVNIKYTQEPVQYLMQDDADLQFLKNSKDQVLNSIYANVEAGRPGSIVPSDGSVAAIEKVSNGLFAYVDESIELPQAIAAAKNGSMQVFILPGSLGGFYVSLAVQQGSPLREKLNIALLQLAESGVLQNLLNAAGVVST